MNRRAMIFFLVRDFLAANQEELLGRLAVQDMQRFRRNEAQ